MQNEKIIYLGGLRYAALVVVSGIRTYTCIVLWRFHYFELKEGIIK